MGGISSNGGLASGIDTASLIGQLLAIESRPRVLAEQRVLQLQQEQGAWLSINSALSGLRTTAGAFRLNSLFSQTTASSSNPDALEATAASNATPGAYTFLVGRLVTTEQRLSRGFGDTDTTGVGATGFTFESTKAELQSRTLLSELNGGEGIERGTIRITDKAGGSAEIDLSQVVDVNDVLDAINANASINVTAEVDGDRLVIRDNTGAGGDLTIEDTFGSTTATSLGIAGTASGADTEVLGSNLRTISGATDLAILNDGLGVRIEDGVNDLEITARDGSSFFVDLGRLTETEPDDGDPETEEETTVLRERAQTLQDVIDIINQTASDEGVAITASVAGDGSSLVISDATGGTDELVIESVGGRTTAEDLRIATGAAGVAQDSFQGGRVVGAINTVLTRTRNGGQGLGNNEFTFTDRAGNSTTVTVSQNALDGSITDLIDELNQGLSDNGVSLPVGLNGASNGFAVTDTSGGNGNIVIAGEGADAVGLATDGVAGNSFQGASAQKQWIGLSTRLDDLNDGNGIGTGTVRIVDAAGDQSNIELTDSLETVADLLNFLHTRPGARFSASLNAQGDGIQITDDSGGGGQLRIEAVSGFVAESLNIEGTFDNVDGAIVVDGTYEQSIEIAPSDTHADILTEINSAGAGVTASIVNDGSPGAPFRLSLTARNSGEAGRVLVDTRGVDLGFTNISDGRDAVVFYGSGDPKDALLITSSSNTIDNIATGLDISLRDVTGAPVTVVVNPDNAPVTEGITSFVDAFNTALRAIDDQSFFNRETERGGPLVGDSTARRIRRELTDAIQQPIEGVEGNRFRFLFEIGIRFSGSSTGSGNELTFDQAKFDAAYAEDPQAVEDLFAAFGLERREPIVLGEGITTPDDGPDRFTKLGVMEQIRVLVDGFTSTLDGVITGRTNTIDEQIRLQQERIENFNIQLEDKRQNLTIEFANLELAIANLQNQQFALSGIQAPAFQF